MSSNLTTYNAYMSREINTVVKQECLWIVLSRSLHPRLTFISKSKKKKNKKQTIHTSKTDGMCLGSTYLLRTTSCVKYSCDHLFLIGLIRTSSLILWFHRNQRNFVMLSRRVRTPSVRLRRRKNPQVIRRRRLT